MCDQQSLRSACAYAQSDQTFCWSLEYSISVKLLTEHHLKFLAYKGGCTRQAPLSLHLSKCHIVRNHMPRLILFFLQMNDAWNVPVKVPENYSFKGGREPK